jgi:hypothetical protein
VRTVTETTVTEQPGDDRDGTAPGRLRGIAVEAGVGLVIALLLLWVAIASTTDVPFVYQGL